MTKRGFDRERHKRVLINLLVNIIKDSNGKVAFKGGTCAALFYDLPRISLDLDFDILEPFNEGDIDRLREILERRGSVQDFREKHFTIFFLLNYEKGAPNIKIEFNKRIWKHNVYKPVWFLGVEMKIADEPTLLTNKIVALTDRKMAVARDLYDSYYLLKLGYPLNEKLILERTGKTREEYIRSLISFIQRTYTAKNILHGLGEVLDEREKEWARKELIQETIRELERIEQP